MKKRSPCPVSSSLEIFGDKWTLLLIRDLFAGRSHYNEFLSSPEKISTNILADRLKRLEQESIIEKYPSGTFPGKSGYQLTAKGRAIFPVLDAIASWGLGNIEGTQSYIELPRPGEQGSLT